MHNPNNRIISNVMLITTLNSFVDTSLNFVISAVWFIEAFLNISVTCWPSCVSVIVHTYCSGLMYLCALHCTARSVEAAAMLHKEAGNFSQAADLIEQASTMYLEHGTQDTAAVVLDRAGKWAAYTAFHLPFCQCFLSTVTKTNIVPDYFQLIFVMLMIIMSKI